MKEKWKNYEEVAAYLLNQFAKEFELSRVEEKQKIKGRLSGTKWEIDAKGVKEGDVGFVIVECRRYTTSKQNQERLGSLAYRIKDTGADGAILVSPLGMQEGAEKIAKAENIIHVHLNANSAPYDFVMQFLKKLMVGVSEKIIISESVTVKLYRSCLRCGAEFIVKENEKICPNCMPKEDQCTS